MVTLKDIASPTPTPEAEMVIKEAMRLANEDMKKVLDILTQV